jgi:hypothetical protein
MRQSILNRFPGCLPRSNFVGRTIMTQSVKENVFSHRKTREIPMKRKKNPIPIIFHDSFCVVFREFLCFPWQK